MVASSTIISILSNFAVADIYIVCLQSGRVYLAPFFLHYYNEEWYFIRERCEQRLLVFTSNNH